MHALGVDLRADAECVFDFKARDETGTEFAAQAGVLGKFAERTIVGERDKGGA